jgi:hypothetical protein
MRTETVSMNKLRVVAALMGLAVLPVSAALAQGPVAVLPAPIAPARCALTDVVLFDLTQSLACASFAGVNDENSQGAVTSFLNGTFGSAYGGWGSEAVGFTSEGVSGPFSNNPTATAGSLFFNELVGGYFAISLKASTGFSLYILNGGAEGVSGVTYSTVGAPLNPGGQVPGLSHAGLWSGDDFCNGDCEPSVSVPEPSTFAMMFVGLLGLGAAARRRRNA